MRGRLRGALGAALYLTDRHPRLAGDPAAGGQYYWGFTCTHVWPHQQYVTPPDLCPQGCGTPRIANPMFVRLVCDHPRCGFARYYAVADADRGAQHHWRGHQPKPFRAGD
jgi:hypothetical protein